MPINAGDHAIMVELDYIRAERKRLKIHKANLTSSLAGLQSRLDASTSPKLKREMRKRIDNRRAEIYSIAIDLGFLDRSWNKIIVRAKLRGLADDRQIAQWQGEDYASL